MKKETILKIITILLITILLGTITTNVYAADGAGSFFDDITGDVDQSGTTTQQPTTPSEGDTQTPPAQDTNTNNYDTNLPHAGAAENTVMIIAVLALGIVAVCAYRKMKYYNNI